MYGCSNSTGTSFFVYRNPKAPAVIKSKGFMLLVLIGFFCYAFKINNAFHISSTTQMANKILSNGTSKEENLIYHSLDGFAVLIPAGYSYVIPPSGAERLVALNKESSGL